MEAATVVALVQNLRLLLVDSPDIAHRVGKQLAVGVMAHQLRIHCDTGHAVPVHRQQRPFFLSEPESKGHRLIGTSPLQFQLEIFQVGLGDWHQSLQLCQRSVEVLDPLTDNVEDMAGPVVRQQHAVAVKYQAALGRQGLQLYTVALGLSPVGLVVVDLQVVVARQNRGQQGQHHQYGKHRAGAEDPDVAAGVLEGDVLWHGVLSLARLPAWGAHPTRDDTGARR